MEQILQDFIFRSWRGTMCTTIYQVFCLVIGYSISLVVGHLVTSRVTRYLWDIAERDVRKSKNQEQYLPTIRTTPIIALWHGTAERFLYTSTIILGRPEGIAVWLAFKAVMRWKVYEDDPRHIPGSAIYVVGTIVSLMFGILGGLIAIRQWNL